MRRSSLTISVEQLYGEVWARETSLDDELARSLTPRGTDSLFEMFASLGPSAGDVVVDVGARDASHAIRLVREHAVRVVALDPVPLHVELAKRAVADAGLADAVDVVEAPVESMPLDDSAADWIWCRDVLVHADVERGFAECARVLRRGGRMFVYVTLATELLEPREAKALFDAVAVVPASTNGDALERHAAAAGLSLVSKTALAGEWRERMVEDGTWDAGGDLVRLSRLRRRESDLVERHGARAIRAYEGGKLWGIYQLLGKLCPTVFVWERDA